MAGGTEIKIVCIYWQWHTEEQAKQTEWEPGLLQIVLLTTASYVRISSKLEED